jgi:hypothetical protein
LQNWNPGGAGPHSILSEQLPNPPNESIRSSIVNAVEEGRAVFENIRKFLTYILAHNVPELIPYLAFVL